jgi:hypothetical protein
MGYSIHKNKLLHIYKPKFMSLRTREYQMTVAKYT